MSNASSAARLLQVVRSTKRRGAEVHALDLGAALRDGGMDVTTVALTAAADGVLLPVLGRHSLAPRTLRELERAMAGADHVVSHGSRSLPACAMASVATRRRFVYRSIGDAVFWARAPSRRSRVALYLRRASDVVALWPAAADAIVRRYGVPPERVTVIPTGVPAARFPPADAARRTSVRAQLGLPAEQPVAVYLGWLSPEKGPALAIEALASAPDVVLVIAGDGPQRAELERLARTGGDGRVRFLGATDDPSAVLTAADVLVLPASVEGLPAVLIEAGLTGLPVVATDVGAVREVVVDGSTGIVVPSGDASALGRGIVDAVAAAGELGAAARERCLDRFEINVVADAWRALLAP